MHTTNCSNLTHADFRTRSVLEVATFSVFLILASLILPLLSMLNAKFMAFHEAEMSTILTMLNSIPIIGWLAIASAGCIVLWLKSRASSPLLSSFTINLTTLLLVMFCGIVCAVIFVAPMFAILSALSA